MNNIKTLRYSTLGCLVAAVGHWLVGSSEIYISTFLVFAAIFSTGITIIQALDIGKQ